MRKKQFLVSVCLVACFLTVLVIMNTYAKMITPEKHEELIIEKGWRTASYFPKKESFLIPEYPEALQTFNRTKVHFDDHINKNISQYRYRLKESCTPNEFIEAVILTANGEIFASYLSVSNSKPGVTEMMEKDVYMDEICFY